MKQSLIDFYLDWVNNFLTIERLAEYYQLPVQITESLIKIGKELHESKVADYKNNKDGK